MKVNFEHDRLELVPETKEEEQFCKDLHHSIPTHPGMMSWYGDVDFDKVGARSGYVFTHRPEPESVEVSDEEIGQDE